MQTVSGYRDFSKAERIVIKVGTNVLTTEGRLDTGFLRVVARQIVELCRGERQVILVTSGAIGMGAGALGLDRKVTDVKKRQACAAVGQGILMHEYYKAFGAYKQKVAQVLLTNTIMSRRKNYLNLKNAMEALLKMGIVPIVNENDCVSIDEIDLAFGDNDKLSALIASKIDAELLIMLTDVGGLYDRDPGGKQQGRLIAVVVEVTAEIEKMAGRAGSALGTGGMHSKLEAVRIAAHAGCKVVLAHGRDKDVIVRIVGGEEIGTLFLPKRRLSNRKRWILNSAEQGRIEVDVGAAAAIANSKSLLLAGITGVSGTFESGEVVAIGVKSGGGVWAKGLCGLGAEELRDMLASKGKAEGASKRKTKAIVHANDIILLDDGGKN